MNRRIRLSAVAMALAMLAWVSGDAWARGFGGGFRGGGGARFGGGGFRGGGGARLGGGGFSGGRLGGGGLSGRLGSGGGFTGRAGGSLGGNRLGGSGLNSRVGVGDSGGNRLGGGDRLGGAGLENRGLGGRTGEGLGADRFGGAGAGRGAGLPGLNFNSRPNTSQLNQFLGMPGDAGIHSVANSHPLGNDFNLNRGAANNFDVNRGAVVGPRGGVAGGATVTGPRGTTVGRGAAVGPRGGVVAGRGVEGAGGRSAFQAAAIGPAGGFGYISPSVRYTNAAAVRANFADYGRYTAGWYTAHPGAWYAAGWIGATAWRAATWPAIGRWFDYDAGVDSVSYDYGSNVVYQDNSVYVGGQAAGSADDYYQQAQTLATSADQSQPAADNDQWMPLGVFAVTQPNQTKPIATLQLAVDKSGNVGGNYTDNGSGQTLPVHGSVDKKTQRVAWTMGDDTDRVVEAGLYNLTKDEATALVHDGKDSTEQWLLVRPQQGGQSNQQQANQQQ